MLKPKIPQKFRKIPEISLKNPKFSRKFPKNPKNLPPSFVRRMGGLASPDRGVLPIFRRQGVLADTPIGHAWLLAYMYVIYWIGWQSGQSRSSRTVRRHQLLVAQSGSGTSYLRQRTCPRLISISSSSSGPFLFIKLCNNILY